MLEGAAAAELPVMIFVGNPGCVQIHSGPVRRIEVMGPWLNVLDPRFNLHLREDLIRVGLGGAQAVGERRDPFAGAL